MHTHIHFSISFTDQADPASSSSSFAEPIQHKTKRKNSKRQSEDTIEDVSLGGEDPPLKTKKRRGILDETDHRAVNLSPGK
jgi:hypothetical protein